MPTHTLHRKQTLHGTIEVLWEFFSNPRNLSRITPPTLGFEILTPDLPQAIYPGLMIAYRVRPLFGVPMHWLTEITHVEGNGYFVDEQRSGPYALWHHEHWFRAVGSGKVEVEDRITYRLPFGWLSEPVHALLARPQLEAIFDYRELAVEKCFPAGTSAR